MKTELEQEAKEYSDKTWDMVPTYMETSSERENTITDFIAGAKSKYVEKEKILFAIEQVKDIDKKCFGGSNTCKAKIKELEKK